MFGRVVGRALNQLGVTVHTGARVEDLDESGLRCRGAGGEYVLPADRVLVATGRRPNTDDLGLSAARIAVGEDSRIAVGADRMISGTNIAAIGDVVSGPMLAHKATAEAIVAAEAACGRRVAFDAVIPLVVFSAPEVASVGSTLQDASAAGVDARAVTVPMSATSRAVVLGEPHGFTQLVVDVERDVVIGVHIAGPHASELIAEAVLAVELAASPADLAATIHPHPTMSEGIYEAARRYAAWNGAEAAPAAWGDSR
jgi:dihydrolipoamide dehydrogenase